MEEQQLNINLCLEVEKYPYLYDVTRADHSKRSVVEKAWAEVGKELGLSGSLGTYTSSSATQYFHCERIAPGEENSQQYASQDQDESLTRDSEEQHIENRQELSYNEDSTSTVFDSQTTQTIRVNSARNPRKTAKPSSDADQAFVEYFQAKKQKAGTDSECPRKQFLLSLLPEVSDLPETKFRMFKRRVFGLLDDLHKPDLPMTSNTASSYSGSRLTDSPLFSPESLSLQDYDSFGGTRPLAIPMQSSSDQTACENNTSHIVML